MEKAKLIQLQGATKPTRKVAATRTPAEANCSLRRQECSQRRAGRVTSWRLRGTRETRGMGTAHRSTLTSAPPPPCTTPAARNGGREAPVAPSWVPLRSGCVCVWRVRGESCCCYCCSRCWCSCVVLRFLTFFGPSVPVLRACPAPAPLESGPGHSPHSVIWL